MLKHPLVAIVISLSLIALTKGGTTFTTSSNSLLDSGFRDFTVDASDSCSNVEIELSADTTKTKTGILHSSYYNSIIDTNESCRWRFSADQDYRIELTFVEYTANCQTKTENRLKIESNKSLWINFTEPDNATALNLSNNQFKSCDFNLRPLTKLETISNSLLIEYDRGSVDFLIFFSITRDLETKQDLCTDNKKCSVEYDLEGLKRTHNSCVSPELLCRCAGNCDKLVERYSEFYSTEGTINYSCQYYGELNDLCERANNLFQPLLKAEESEDETIKQQVSENHFARKFVPFNPNQADHMECGNLRLSSEYGWISSANFDMSKSYANDQDCYYFIQLQPNQKVQLRFKYFDLNPNVTSVVPQTEDPDIVLLSSAAGSSKRSSLVLSDMPNLKEDAIILTSNMLRNFFKSSKSQSNNEEGTVKMPPNLGITYDYDYLNIYDGPSIDSPLLAHLTSKYNNFNKNFNGYVYNSKSNNLLLKFHSAARPDEGDISAIVQETSPPKLHQGFNLTYQIKGFCIEDQKSCNSIYELNCYSPSQVCNDVWDCHNGADERGCGPCKHDQFRCKNHIFCYRLEDRCDGDHQCLDFSDELNCNSWFCNSNNGTFLCDNEQCVYEQWVCDGTNDCRDGSDERNCPTPFTRRVITTAVLGGTLCSLLLVMALGCACKLYTLHTVGYRNNIRLSQTVQSAAAAAAAAPLLTSTSMQIPTVATLPSSQHSSQTTTEMNTVSTNADNNTTTNNNSGSTSRSTSTGIINNLSNIFRRNNSNNLSNSTESERNNTSAPSSQPANQSGSTSEPNATNPNATNNGYQFNFNNTTNSTGTSSNNVPPGELPLPHHLIAPPTYNQTMGLVDEYEQRQLAFIEHVRSILAQQQSQNGGAASGSSGLNLINLNSSGQSSFSALTLIPTVTSSSTTVHRVSSSSRRSHSGRHHRHHYHNRSSSNNVDSANPQANGANTISDQMNTIVSGGGAAGGLGSGSSGSGNGRSHRSHRHHYRHSNHSQARGHSIHHHITNNLTQVNFDANRRGLITQPEATPTTEPSEQPALASTQTSTSSQSQSQPRTSSTDGSNTATNNNNNQVAPIETLASTSGQNLTSTLTQMSNKTTSVNLRDKIAKLIKDIVVHHGDNIQYVQLADQLNGSQRNNNSSFSSVHQSPENSIELTSSARNRADSNEANTNGIGQSQETFIDSVNQEGQDNTTASANASHGTSAMNTSNNNNNNNGSESDDVPLIQP